MSHSSCHPQRPSRGSVHLREDRRVPDDPGHDRGAHGGAADGHRARGVLVTRSVVLMKRISVSVGAPLALIVALGVAFDATPAAGSTPRFSVQVEGGGVWQTRNDVQIPNDATATRFSLCELVGMGPWPAGRVYVTWRAGERHALRALFAPLSITGTGVPDGAIAFAGKTYAPATPVEATYQFNSYRLSYRYRLHEGDRWTWWAGFTAKVRDAKIELRQGATSSGKTDVGFVPLLHLAGAWRFARGWSVALDADALAGGPGRAEDAALTLARDLGTKLTLYGGYRTVEGGADVDEVYAFAWLHYAVAGLEYRF